MLTGVPNANKVTSLVLKIEVNLPHWGLKDIKVTSLLSETVIKLPHWCLVTGVFKTSSISKTITMTNMRENL